MKSGNKRILAFMFLKNQMVCKEFSHVPELLNELNTNNCLGFALFLERKKDPDYKILGFVSNKHSYNGTYMMYKEFDIDGKYITKETIVDIIMSYVEENGSPIDREEHEVFDWIYNKIFNPAIEITDEDDVDDYYIDKENGRPAINIDISTPPISKNEWVRIDFANGIKSNFIYTSYYTKEDAMASLDNINYFVAILGNINHDNGKYKTIIFFNYEAINIYKWNKYEINCNECCEKFEKGFSVDEISKIIRERIEIHYGCLSGNNIKAMFFDQLRRGRLKPSEIMDSSDYCITGALDPNSHLRTYYMGPDIDIESDPAPDDYENKKRKEYLSWTDYFMGIAELSAKRSKDPNTQVGACIVDETDNHILSVGYNGFPRGCDDDKFPWGKKNKEYNKYLFVVHAELNAILNYRGESLKGATLYVTLFPCNECVKAIIQSGISRVVFKDDKHPEKFEHFAACKMLKAADIIVDKYELPVSE